jgi:hypothetical protein
MDHERLFTMNINLERVIVARLRHLNSSIFVSSSDTSSEREVRLGRVAKHQEIKKIMTLTIFNIWISKSTSHPKDYGINTKERKT